VKLVDIFEAPKQTAWVILFTSDKLILGKRAPTSSNPNQWNFFGGGVDEGESPVEAAVRELKEEAHVSVTSGQLKKIAEIGNATYFSYKIDSPASASTSNEISKIKAFKLTDLPDNLHSKTQTFFDKLENLLQ
jgi:8-oxo-dGTP pyrophosphatase MutT (NUDIX family)